MMHSVTVAILLASGLALTVGHSGTFHAESIFDQMKNLKDTAESIAGASQATAFDGVWFSNQLRYGFKIRGKIGIATQSNSPKFKPGDVILRINSISGQTFRGTQIYKDGVWRQVTGQLAGGALRINGPGGTWIMMRVSTGTADQAKVPSAQTATQDKSSKQATRSSSNKTDIAVSSAKTSVSHGPARDMDIVGLRIGMSADEATKVLMTRHSKGKQSKLDDTFEGLPPTRVLYGLHSENALPGYTTETIRVAVAGSVNAPTVVGVTRTELYFPGKETDRQSLLQALIGKYGKPDYTEQRPHADSLTWFLDTGSTKPYCRNAFVHMTNKTNITGNPGSYPECGRVLQAHTSGSGPNQNLIGRLEVGMYDYRLAYDGINKAREQVAASAARLRAEESKRAKANKPSL